jgi:hypothetical protein
MTTGDEDNCVYSKSPFLFHEGIHVECANSKKTCTYDEIHSLRRKELINEIDWKIIQALFIYRFLNRHCLEKYINFENEIFMKKDSLKKNISKLVSQGILLKYYFTFDTTSQQGTPCFYTLSQGAFSFYKKRELGFYKYDKYIDYDIPNETSILNQLIYNQFHIFFLRQNKKSILKELYYEKVRVKNHDLCINGFFRLMINNDGLKQQLDLVVIPIRRSPQWQQEFCLKLYDIYSYARRKPDKIKDPIILTICEDDVQIKEAFLYKECHAETKGIFTVFTSDITLITDEILKNLYYCELTDGDQVIQIVNKMTGDEKLIPLNAQDKDIYPSIYQDERTGIVIYDAADPFTIIDNNNNIIKISVLSLDTI